MKSNTHKESQEIVKTFYRKKGWIAITEHFIRGKKIDILSQEVKTKYTIANEIQLTPKHTLENIDLDFRAGCDEVIIISIDQKVLEQIKKKTFQELSEELLKKIKFQLINEFIPLKNNNKIKQNKAEFNTEFNVEQNPKREEVITWKNKLV